MLQLSVERWLAALKELPEIMVELPTAVDTRTDEEYRRQIKSILFPLIIFFFEPLIGFLALSFPMWVYPSAVNTYTLSFILIFYIWGTIPAATAAILLLLIARRVPAIPHLIVISPFVSFVATIPFEILRRSPATSSAALRGHVVDAFLSCGLWGVAALGSVLLALALRCVPSPIGK